MKITFILRNSCFLISLILLSEIMLAQHYPGPLSPEESIKKLQVADGFKIQVYASEPYVFDPVALEFDEQGDAYVVEMPDYPFEVERGKGKGRIRILKDINSDGRIDKSVIFAENITEATSILPYKGGLIVTAAPDILYLKDTNEDGKSDIRETIFTGFFENNSEAQITSLRYGIDNWIYAANSGQSGQVTLTKGGKTLNVAGADFRFRLDRGQFEVETGSAQFGHTINDWGHRFMSQNTLHIRQAVIPRRYILRNPHLPTQTAAKNISDHELDMYQISETPYWRAARTEARNRDFKANNINRVEYARGKFTGASGGTVYTGNAFENKYYGNIFTSDVAGNLVHRDVVTLAKNSPVYIASRDTTEKNKEFIASSDTWFRPVNFTVGPDGYLYVLDYYRQHIETPVSIPDSLKTNMDFLAGNDMGRIYRVLPVNAGVKKISFNLKNSKSGNLLVMLSHPNGWWRMQAHRLLVERQDKSVVQGLKNIIKTNKDPRARLHALYVLEGLNALNAGIVKQALQDTSAGVRENAIMLAERYPETLSMLSQKVNDPSIRVAFQAALSLGEFSGQGVTSALAQFVNKYGYDQWFKTAILSSQPGSSVELFNVLVQQNLFFTKDASWKLAFLQDISNIIGARGKRDEIHSYLSALSQPLIQNTNWQLAAVKGLKVGLGKARDIDDQMKTTVQNIKTGTVKEAGNAILDLKKVYQSAN